MKHVKLKWLVSASNAGEVIDKSYWGDGDESLYTCARDILRSDFSAFPKWKRTTADDLLLTRNGTPYIHIPVEGAIYSNVVQRISVPKVDKYFLRYALEDRVRSFRGYGVSIESLNYEMWSNLEVALPDLATQRQIADFLDRETARIDLLIEKKQRLVALLRERATSFITQVTKHGLKGETHVDTCIDWWSRAPASWEVHRIATLFGESKEMGEEGLPVLSVSINWGISDRELADEDRDRIVNHIEDKTAYKRVRTGDLVYNMMRAWQGAFGVAKIDGLVSPAYVVARPRKGLHSAYFEHLLRTPSCVEEFRRASKGIADFRQRLYWEHFRQVRLMLPSYEEQVEIAAYIERKQAQSAPIISKTQDSIGRLKEYRSALITAAVTGQIDVATYAKLGTPDRRLDAIQEEMGA
ncbi:restriction endonuclease subunit S [Phycobacter sp. K97]|uniref:restriction endonuclease subunit S n=1 Tax=Phycobacter sedimenti TaxID=3133977 RepID=UPI00311E62FF